MIYFFQLHFPLLQNHILIFLYFLNHILLPFQTFFSPLKFLLELFVVHTNLFHFQLIYFNRHLNHCFFRLTKLLKQSLLQSSFEFFISKLCKRKHLFRFYLMLFDSPTQIFLTLFNRLKIHIFDQKRRFCINFLRSTLPYLLSLSGHLFLEVIQMLRLVGCKLINLVVYFLNFLFQSHRKILKTLLKSYFFF